MSAAKLGDKVKVHYKGKTEDGEEFASTYDEEAILIVIGNGEIWEAIEQELIGMSPGEKSTVIVPKDESIPYLEELIFDLPRSSLPKDLKPFTGAILQLQDPGGQIILAKIISVEDETIRIDSNHPLAGQNLEFTVELVEIC
jgi:peptidylprolyl isomerase